MTSLTIRVGALDLYSTVEVASYAFMTSRAQSWALHNHVLRDNEIYDMKSDFDRSLDGLRVTILEFDLSNFNSKDTVTLKVQYILVNVLFIKSVQNMDVKFDMTT